MKSAEINSTPFKAGRFERILFSAGYRNFRLFFIGHAISLLGTWIQRIALPWLVYQKTESPVILGLVALSGLAPSFVLSPAAGVFIDRWSRYYVVTVSQVLSLVQAVLLTCCCYAGNISIETIIGLNIFLGIINAFEMPARHAFMLEIISNKNDYYNAVIINSVLVNTARIAGPSAAALIIAQGGESLCFLINSASYFVVIISLMMMKNLPETIKNKNTGLLKEMKEGFLYAFRYQPLKNVLFIYGILCFAGWPCTVLMPVIARNILHGGPATFSMLMTASGAGAFIGALFLGLRKKKTGFDHIIAYASVFFGAGMITLSFSNSLVLSVLTISLTGACMMILMSATISFIQTIIEESKRGRIMSCYTMIFTGAAPAGSYLAGELSVRVGTPQTLLLGGIACIAGALVYFNRITDC